MRGTRRAYWLVALFTLTGAAVSDSSAARKKAVPKPKASKACANKVADKVGRSNRFSNNAIAAPEIVRIVTHNSIEPS